MQGETDKDRQIPILTQEEKIKARNSPTYLGTW